MTLGSAPAAHSRAFTCGRRRRRAILPYLDPNRHMKRLKRVGIIALGGFVAFAPPGTLILLASLALAFLGKFWLMVGILCLAVPAAVWLLFKRKARPQNQAAGKR